MSQNSEYYDYLFKLRSSDFSHHTPEKITELLFSSLKKSVGDTKSSFNTLNNDLDGELGFFSANDLTNLKYRLAGTSFFLSLFMIENNVDPEYAYSTGDYFIFKMDKATSVAQMVDIFNEMAKRYGDLLSTRRQESYGYPIDKCIHYIEQNLYSPLTSAQVAGYMALSPEYLTTLFKKRTGKTLYQFILDKKIEEGRRMLRHSSIPIETISGALGFHSTSHFSNAFKKRAGTPPSQFRLLYNDAATFFEKRNENT